MSDTAKKIDHCGRFKKGENPPGYGKKGRKHFNYGQTHSDATKKIMSEAKKGQPRVEGSGKPSQIFKQ